MDVDVWVVCVMLEGNMRKTFLRINKGIYNAVSDYYKATLFFNEVDADFALDFFMGHCDKKTQDNAENWFVHKLTKDDLKKMTKNHPSVVDKIFNRL